MKTLQDKALIAELEAYAIRREIKVGAMREVLRKTYEHIKELAEAWERGVISEHDGKGGTRSNRNHDVMLLIRAAMKERKP